MYEDVCNIKGGHGFRGPAVPGLHFTGEFGVRADSKLLDEFQVSAPMLSRTGKAWLTINQFGFETATFQSNWVIREVLEGIQHGNTILDVGAGYGAFSKAALEKGAMVVSNDLALEHLLWTRSSAGKEYLAKLFLNQSRFPNLNLPHGSLDCIFAHRVLHFLTGEDIEQGLHNCLRWLKPGGSLGIVAMNASHASFGEKFYPIYLKRKEAGENGRVSGWK